MAIFCSVSRCIFVTFREEANNFHTVICAIHPKEITLNNVEWPFYVKIMASVGMSVNLSVGWFVSYRLQHWSMWSNRSQQN